MESPFVSVVMVNYNGASFLPACLNGLRHQSYPADCFEVIVSDNNSSDESIHIIERDFPWVRVIKNHTNLGFAAGNNVAFREARGEYLALLNNDTRPAQQWLDKLIEVAQIHPSAGIVTGRLQLFYNQIALKFATETFNPTDDKRDLGVQLFKVESGAQGGVIQYLDGFYGSERHPSGIPYRWTKGEARLGVPVPDGSGSWSLSLFLAASRPKEERVQLQVFLKDTLLAEWMISGREPAEFKLELEASSREFATPLIQNAGSIVFRSGAGRDRGTYVRGTEVLYEEDHGQYDQVEEVFAGCGANLLMRRELLADISDFDSDFFMYYEDTDLSWRARLRGWKVMYAPEAIVRHIHCGSSGEWSPQFLYLTERNRLAMVFKNGEWKQVSRVWGGYFYKVIRTAFGFFSRLLLAKSGRRNYARQLWLHLHVLFTLVTWQPFLWRKRFQIQEKSKIHPRQLKTWFIE